jgi:hypothetical protein
MFTGSAKIDVVFVCCPDCIDILCGSGWDDIPRPIDVGHEETVIAANEK